jgi:hypothetical protein
MTHYTVMSEGKLNHRPQGGGVVPKAHLSEWMAAHFVAVASFDNVSKDANLD